MSAVAVLVADGFETIECLTMVDVLRRGGVRAMLVSIMATREAVSSQQVNIVCDATLDEGDMNEFDYIVLPGGMPGTTNLGRDQRVLRTRTRVCRQQARSCHLRSPLHSG